LSGVVEKEVEIVNRLGLHARAAAKLVQTASAFRSRVLLVTDDEEVDAKSILGLLLLAAAQGTRLRVRCEGPDEEEALAAVAALIANRFEEES
jgi:phosphocarrier protein